MCGPLCDAVLERSGSTEALEELALSNLLLVLLDRRGQWYRHHYLFRDMLLAELERQEPQMISEHRSKSIYRKLGPSSRSQGIAQGLSKPAWNQLHFDCVASEKLFTALTTVDASFATAATCAAEGDGGNPWTVLLSALTDDVTALVWLGKSLLAELATAAASLWILLSCDFRPLIPLLTFRLVSPLTEFWRLVRSEQ